MRDGERMQEVHGWKVVLVQKDNFGKLELVRLFKQKCQNIQHVF